MFAQLLSGGENHGVHTFLVRIRNEDMSVVPGTRIEDMGHKIGCNGVDNGKLYVVLLLAARPLLWVCDTHGCCTRHLDQVV